MHDVLIIGGGVTGTALLYKLSQEKELSSICLIDKYPKIASVNSAPHMNSQTLHFGDIETNYTLEKAKKVKAAAELVKQYIESHKGCIYTKVNKMVIAIGKDEVKRLEKRHKEFKQLFPHLKKLDRKEIKKLEPNVLRGRDPSIPVMALSSAEGYTIDYQQLSDSFVKEAKKTKKTKVILGRKVTEIKKEQHGYTITLPNKKIQAKVVVVCAGADSLTFAHHLSYGKDWILLPVAGSYFLADNVLNGKVYTMQLKKLPFAAVHGDPDVHNPHETRFGPTAKVLPMLERRNYHSVLDFLKLFEFRWDAIRALLSIVADPIIYRFIARNVLYDLPLLGRIAFLKEVKKIVPSITLRQLRYGQGYGGLRPQIVNVKKRATELGEAKIKGDNIIFNITPSPGASTCLQNAMEDTQTILKLLKEQ